jgi:presenilin-like A22 family membrane protease
MKDSVPVIVSGILFIFIHGLALLILKPYEALGMTVFENPDDPSNIIFFFLTLIIFTVVILLIAKYWKKQAIRGIILVSTGYTIFYVLYPLLVLVLGVWSLLFSIIIAFVIIFTLVKHPEWYVIDISGIILGAGIIAILGLSLNILLTISLLLILAIYDAISVYKTKHMIDLADIIVDLKLPVILIIPKTIKYSLLKETRGLKEKLEDEEERSAFFIGLGDVIFPGLLVASIFHNLPDNGLLIALSVMIGTLFGFALLMAPVRKGKPQAGLPYLCGGAIMGYLVSSFLLFGELAGLPF